MHHHVQDPAGGNGEASVLWGFSFYILPTGVHGAHCDVLDDAQEAGDANGNTPAHTLNVQNKFAYKITEEIFQRKSCHCPGNTISENDEGIGHTQMLENQISGP